MPIRNLRFLFVALLLAVASPWLKAADLDIVDQRVKDSILASTASVSTVQSYQSSLQANGSWSDINYGSTAQTAWTPVTHLDRVHAMARAYKKPGGSLYQNLTLKADILLAYDYWISRNPQSSNWWYNQISVPQKLGEILVLIRDDLSAAQKTSGINVVKRAYVARSTNSGTNTGANRIDRAYASILRGVVTPDSALTSESFLAIGDTIIVTTSEGIQPDYSFQQHGAQLYIGGYGVVFVDGVLKYGMLGAGTTYTYSPDQVRILVDYLVDGVPWFVRGDTIDYTATGRGLSRKSSTATASGMAGQYGNALALNNGYRDSELRTIRTRFQSSQSNHTENPALAPTGNRFFWRSDAATHHRPAWSVSVKTSSTRTLQPESGNGEGLKNLHLADGVTLIQRTGNEYDDIMPVWNWRRLPGTTTEQGTYSLKPSADWGVSGTSTHAGGVSDGVYGASAFNYSRLSVAVKKSWFFFDKEFVALGTALNAPSATNPVQTSLNQSLLNGTVTYKTSSAAAQTLSSGSVTPSGLQWVHHDGTGYFFPTPATTATIQAASQTGTWQSINSQYDATSVSKNVFSLDLGHGTAVSNGQYAYIVVPGIASAAMDAYQSGASIEVLANTAAVQAVRNQELGITAANFWNDSSTSIGGITSNRKACVLVKNDGRFLDVTVSDPTQTNSSTISLQIATPVGGLLSADSGVSVSQLAPGVSMTVAVSGSKGKSFHARFYLDSSAFETNTLSPVADSYVYDGSPSTNYGTADSLILKLGTSSYNRAAVLRFDLSAYNTLPMAATLRLVPTTVQTPGVHAVAATLTDMWSEGGVTWNNRPSNGAASATWTPVLNQPVNADVSASVQAAISDTKSLSLGVYPTTSTSDGYVAYASRENAIPANRPSLSLTFLKNPPVVSVSASLATTSEAGGPPAVFTLTRDGEPTGELTVNFRFGGSASSSDFTASASSITFADGQSSAEVSITAVDDNEPEGTESVILTLMPSAWHAIGTGSAAVNLLDNEISPLFWDADGIASNNTDGGLGGSGTWDTTASNWWNGSSHLPWSNGTAEDVLFRDQPGVVSLGEDIQAKNLYFGSDGYTIADGGDPSRSLTLGGANPSVTITNPAITATIQAELAGVQGLTKEGAGTLVLSGANTYTGVTTVSAGALNFTGDASAADGGWSIGPSASSPATVNVLAGATAHAAEGKLVRIGNTTSSGTASQNLTVSGRFDNAGTLYIGRPATLTLAGGGVWNQDGAMSVNGQGGYSAALIVNAGGSFTYTGASTIKLEPSGGSSGNGLLTLAGGTFTTGRGFERTVATSTGTASLTLSGGGTLRLSGNVPQLTTGNLVLALGTGGGTIDTAGFSISVAVPLANASGQTGSLTKTGSGTLLLGAASTYTGNTTVNAGTLACGSNQSLGSGNVIVNGATAVLDLGTNHAQGAGVVTLDDNGTILGNGTSVITATGSYELKSGSISAILAGSAAINKTTDGVVTLSGANTGSGPVTLAANGGTLVIAHPSALGSGLVKIPKAGVQTGTLAFQLTGTNTIANAFDGFASTTFTGETTFPCAENLSGDTILTSPMTITGMGGNGAYFKSSGGFLTLTGQIRQTVGSIRAFGLGGAAGGLVTGNILASPGGLSLTKDGPGTWTLTGTNTYDAPTTINGGTLRIGDGGATGSLGSAGVNNQATLKIERSNAYTISNAVSGSGRFIQAGSGTTTLTGANSYTGETRVEAGMLVLGQATLADGAAVEVSSGAQLKLNFAGTDQVKRFTIDGVPQASGLWGAPDSGATHESPRLAGSGRIFVEEGPMEAFLTWIATFPSLSLTADQAKDADPDHDGRINLLEFAFDGNPAASEQDSKTRVALLPVPEDGNVLTLTLPVRNGAIFRGDADLVSDPVDGIVYTIQATLDLADFTTTAVEEVLPALDEDLTKLSDGWQYRTFRIAGPAMPTGFLRAVVSERSAGFSPLLQSK